jgi:hypothetical protein
LAPLAPPPAPAAHHVRGPAGEAVVECHFAEQRGAEVKV